jgi:hypothetical protein
MWTEKHCPLVRLYVNDFSNGGRVWSFDTGQHTPETNCFSVTLLGVDRARTEIDLTANPKTEAKAWLEILNVTVRHNLQTNRVVMQGANFVNV